MKKMRLENLEHLCGVYDPREVAKIGFKLIEDQIRELRKIGLETDMPEIVILKDTEYSRTEVFEDAND